MQARILVVDDNAVNRALVSTLVRHRGDVSLEAADGAEGLALAVREQPNLVICDILMPTMDGYEFVRRLRETPAIAATPVIFYSAYYHESQARQLAQACGVLRVLSKPCEPADILAAIEESLGGTPLAPPASIAAGFDYAHLRLVTDQLSAKADELEQSNRKMAALTELNLRLASEKEPRQLLDSVCRGARDLLGASYAVLLVRDKNAGGPAHCSTCGIDTQAAAALPLPTLDSGWLGEVSAGRRSSRQAGAPGAMADTGLPQGYPPARSALAAPIVSLQHVYGWICLCDKPGLGAFTAEDERLLTILAAQFGRIYENGSLYYQLNQHAEQLQEQIAERERTSLAMVGMLERLEALRQLDAEILAARSPGEVARLALQCLEKLLPYWGASIITLDAGRPDTFAVLAATRGSGELLDLAPADGLAFERFGADDLAVLKSGRVRDVPDVTSLERPSAVVKILSGQGMRSYVRLPMIVEGALVGALSLGSDQPDYFSADRIAYARSVADHLGIAIQQALLRERIARQAAEMEQRVVERTAQLAAANEDLKSFSYTVSHDLRAPLRAINGFSLMFEQEYGAVLDGEARGLFERIRDSGRRMETLVEDLLKFAQVGMASIRAVPIDMSQLAREAWGELAVPPTVQLRLAQLPVARGDRALLKQVWINLLSNACKYSGKRSDPLVQVEARATAGEIIYMVRDNGAGFDMRYYDRMFGVFQRLHTESEFPGTGVGLAIVQRVVSRHGGRIWAEGETGLGACFSFSLPLLRESAQADSAAP